jgi:hypothetical protein
MQDPKYQPNPDGKTKANLRSAMRAFRVQVEQEQIPRLRAAASRILAEQKQSVLGEVRLHHQHLTRKPGDTSVWWKPEHWNTQLMAALSGSYKQIGTEVPKQINAHKADLGVTFGPAVPVSDAILTYILEEAAKRVTGINDTTRDGISDLIAQGVKDGLSPAELGDVIEGWSGWDEYRSERIATTELRMAYNQAAIGSYRDAGVEMVYAIDGDGDEMCAARNGNTYSIDQAGIEDDLEHPNGTLDWSPIVSEEVA